MIFYNSNQTLYLNSWEYNSVLIINALAGIIKNAGGSVKEGNAGYIVNRSIIEKIEAKKADIARVETFKNEVAAGHYTGINKNSGDAALKEYKKELAALEAIENDPLKVEYPSYISFRLDNKYYYFQFDSNPFFEFYYVKTPITADNTRSKNAVLMELSKKWLTDIYLTSNCTTAEIDAAAGHIFDILTTSKDSYIKRDRCRRSYYNTSYSDRRETITF